MTRKPPAAGKGRPKGAKNKKTRAIEDLARGLTTGNPAYVASLRERLESGKCPPALEVALLHYAHGKPREHVELTGAAGSPLGPITVIVRKRDGE